jgi:hypothetical protein
MSKRFEQAVNEVYPDLTGEEVSALETLAQIAESSPVRFRQVVSETLAGIREQVRGERLLRMIDNAGQLRQERDTEALDRMHGGAGDAA